MKRFLLVLALVFSVLVEASSKFEQKIERLARPYDKAAEFLADVNPSLKCSETVAVKFFDQFGLYKKNDKKKFERSLKSLKKLATKKNLQRDERYFIENKIAQLDKIQKFIVDYAATYYPRMVYNEIAGQYNYIDEQSDIVVDLIIDKPWLLNIATAKDRGLYHFVKKIDLDQRRLTFLLTQTRVKDDLAVEIHQLIAKLTILKDIIVESPEYKKQLSKTRWLKACGIVFVPMLFFIPTILLYAAVAPITMALTIPTMIVFAPLTGLVQASFWAALVTTVQDIKEVRKYEIPVHARSVFSLVAWQGCVIFFVLQILPCIV